MFMFVTKPKQVSSKTSKSNKTVSKKLSSSSTHTPAKHGTVVLKGKVKVVAH